MGFAVLSPSYELSAHLLQPEQPEDLQT